MIYLLCIGFYLLASIVAGIGEGLRIKNVSKYSLSWHWLQFLERVLIFAGGYGYTVNGGSVVTGYTKVFPADEIVVYRTSSSSYSTAVNTTLTVGSRSDTYTITTKSAPAPSGGSKVLKTNGGILKDSTGKVIKTQ